MVVYPNAAVAIAIAHEERDFMLNNRKLYGIFEKLKLKITRVRTYYVDPVLNELLFKNDTRLHARRILRHVL
jgi:hypothetical protein